MAHKSKMLKIKEVEGKHIVRLYTRVSTDRQAEEGYSLGIQAERLQRYVESQAPFDVEYELVVDDGYSGGDLERPGIKKIIEESKQELITHVVVMKLDRLSRSLKDTMYLIEDVFLAHNVAFVSLFESFDTSSPFGRAMIGILSVFAQFERENIFERTRSGMQKRVEAGYWYGGGRVPYGYDYDAKEGILVPNKDANNVRYIYQQYLAGKSMQVLADELGLKYEVVVRNILLRKSNAGFIVYNGEEYKGRHEPLISLETYNTVIEMMEERRKRKVSTKTAHLLTGLVKCGKCGAGMRYAPWGKGRSKLVCYSRQTSKKYLIKDPDCDQPYIWAADIEHAVVNALFEAADKEKVIESSKDNYEANIVETLTEQRDMYKRKLNRLYNLYGESGDRDLLSVIEDVKQNVAKIEMQLFSEKDKNQYIQRSSQVYKKLENIQDCWPHMTVQEQRNIILSIVDEITVNENHVQIKLKYGLN